MRFLRSETRPSQPKWTSAKRLCRTLSGQRSRPMRGALTNLDLGITALLIVADREARMKALARALSPMRRLPPAFTTVKLIREHSIEAPVFYRSPAESQPISLLETSLAELHRDHRQLVDKRLFWQNNHVPFKYLPETACRPLLPQKHKPNTSPQHAVYGHLLQVTSSGSRQCEQACPPPCYSAERANPKRAIAARRRL